MQTFLETKGDMDWLFETHLKALSKDRELYKCAVIYGNEDCPIKIELWKSFPSFKPSEKAKVYIFNSNSWDYEEEICKQ